MSSLALGMAVLRGGERDQAHKSPLVTGTSVSHQLGLALGILFQSLPFYWGSLLPCETSVSPALSLTREYNSRSSAVLLGNSVC